MFKGPCRALKTLNQLEFSLHSAPLLAGDSLMLRLIFLFFFSLLGILMCESPNEEVPGDRGWRWRYKNRSSVSKSTTPFQRLNWNAFSEHGLLTACERFDWSTEHLQPLDWDLYFVITINAPSRAAIGWHLKYWQMNWGACRWFEVEVVTSALVFLASLER